MVKIERCDWCGEDPLYVSYHDSEWGVPVRDSRALFEQLMLEGMQAGLSWLTILRKREHMRTCFLGFEPQALASCGERSVARWMADPGVIRHRGKLQALVSNARAYLELADDFSESVWSFVDGAPVQNRWTTAADVPPSSDASVRLSKWLKQAGFRFVGPTICYAFMQSAGLVNDHLQGCHRHHDCLQLGASWNS